MTAIAIILAPRLGENAVEILWGLSAGALLLIIAIIAHYRLIPAFIHKMHPDDEELLIFAFFLLFFFLHAAGLLGISFVVGAFCAGFTLSAFPSNGLVRGSLASFSDFFAAFFFVLLGLVVPFPSGETLVEASLFAILLVVSTLLIEKVLAEGAGLNTRQSLQSALLLTQTSEFSLILVLKGNLLGLLSEEVFAMVVFLTVATMSLTPLLNREEVVSWLMRRHPRSRRRLLTTQPDGAILLVAFEPPADYLMQGLEDSGLPFLVLSEDAALAGKLCARGVEARHFGNLDRQALEDCGLAQARGLLCVPRNWKDVQLLLEATQGHSPVPPLIPVFDQTQAAFVRAAGGQPIDIARSTEENLIKWCRNLPTASR